ncbi:uncharacterized protein LOC111624838 [Centruroides sculpturatus]|uniref:uncharacterized protein LOC111624838 n=1 Tax=Centruroides sculpturatus TaxID=218467 RepID=UPI000C6DD0CF|nr:uncharacterized protein LOC111624838 [Centruroides sculpturatus]
MIHEIIITAFLFLMFCAISEQNNIEILKQCGNVPENCDDFKENCDEDTKFRCCRYCELMQMKFEDEAINCCMKFKDDFQKRAPTCCLKLTFQIEQDCADMEADGILNKATDDDSDRVVQPDWNKIPEKHENEDDCKNTAKLLKDDIVKKCEGVEDGLKKDFCCWIKQ